MTPPPFAVLLLDFEKCVGVILIENIQSWLLIDPQIDCIFLETDFLASKLKKELKQNAIWHEVISNFHGSVASECEKCFFSAIYMRLIAAALHTLTLSPRSFCGSNSKLQHFLSIIFF